MFGVPQTSEFTKRQRSCEFGGFSFRKNQERASKFGSILGRDRGLVNNCSAAAGRAPNWTGRVLWTVPINILCSNSQLVGGKRRPPPRFQPY